MDSSQLAELRTWAERLRARSEHDESKAAARAILLLIRELETARSELRAERADRAAAAQRDERRPLPLEPESEVRGELLDRPARRMWEDEGQHAGFGGGSSGGLRRWMRRALGDDGGEDWEDEDGRRP